MLRRFHSRTCRRIAAVIVLADAGRRIVPFDELAGAEEIPFAGPARGIDGEFLRESPPGSVFPSR
jgi:hypothetical protein